MRLLALLSFLAVALVVDVPEAGARDIHKEKSLYRNIVVRERGDLRCLVFSVKRGDRNQTCMDMDDPRRLVFPYVRMSLGGLLIEPDPTRILMLGMGGGTIPMVLTEMYPDAKIDVVEIDEAVVRVAQEYFAFRENDNMKIAVADARVFVKRAILQKQSYDFIILDAFTGDYIPEHLMTLEFLEEVKTILDDDGVLVANTFSTSALYDHESETYKAAFGPFFNFKLPITGNRVIIARESGLPSDETIEARAEALGPVLEKYAVDLSKYPQNMSRGQDWNHNRRVLTDQYSPANLLRGDIY